MYCPKCRAEFVPGVTMCEECDVALVDELPPLPEPRYQEMVTVYRAYGPTTMPVAESILQAAKIPYEVQMNDAGTMFGTSGFSIVVPPDNAEDAQALLAELETGEEPPATPTDSVGEDQ